MQMKKRFTWACAILPIAWFLVVAATSNSPSGLQTD
jgi:hypothetical protein